MANHLTQRGRGFTLIEVLLALVILLGGAFISSHIFTSVAAWSSKNVHTENIMTLESRLLRALNDETNFSSHAADFQAGTNPTTAMDLYFHSVTLNQKLGEIPPTGSGKVYFDRNLNNCNIITQTTECIYYTELKWNSPGAGKISNQVKLVKELNVPMATETRSFDIPIGFFDTTKELHCPNDGKFYLGIRSYDTAAGTVECWWFDKTKTCPPNYYPAGLKSTVTAELVLDCTPFPTIYCPNGFAPKKIIVTATGANLSSACVSIKANTTVPRIGHLEKKIFDNIPPQHASNYGLKWLSGKVCPDDYTLKPKQGYTGTLSTDLQSLVGIRDAVSTNPCPTVTPSCGLAVDKIYCDLCPVSNTADSSYTKGCTQRNFAPLPPNRSSTAGCDDPRIFSYNSANVASFQNNYECSLNSSLEFADASLTPIVGSP